MSVSSRRIVAMLSAALLLTALPARATDVDGPNDCTRIPIDFGDAPDGVQAYPAVLGCFPTCLSPGPIGTQNLACAPISTAPGPTGFVRHIHIATDTQYWLGCPTALMGIDSEPDGKVNDTGGPLSACSPTLPVDCFETAFGLTFGQDECYGSTDACLTTGVPFATCASTSVSFAAYNCSATARQVFLNILVDWNQDGDWNDNFQCAGVCAYEWCVKNVLVVLPPGCNTIASPIFVTGPNPGDGWMRITVSDNPVTDDFPWAGSAPMPNSLRNGETEDYPVKILHPQGCPDYEDWGDAPEGALAYPSGVVGRFPTCAFVTGPGTQTSACPPLSTPPGPTGYVRHLSGPADLIKCWLGCGDLALGTTGVDSEINGKTNSTGGPVSICATPVAIDCVEPAFGMNFGQDECTTDPPFDAGVRVPVTFAPCTPSTVSFYATNCRQSPADVFLNILVDWNEDGDWNDNFLCPNTPGACSYEWAVKNVVIILPPGCTPQLSPVFLTGPNGGNGWMRISITPGPVTDDFPWRGSAAGAGGGQDYYAGGETEDYPVTITEPCNQNYREFGDAPEGFQAYTTGTIGRFPTCLMPSPPSVQENDCGTPNSTPPGAATGFVIHTSLASDPVHFWLGCAVDGEADGKTNPIGVAGSPSFCDPGLFVDCGEGFGGLPFGQDECYSDPDAALGTPIASRICSLLTVTYRADLCENQSTQVYLNILADWNRDGDWNDNVACKDDVCSPEWPIKNLPVFLAPGCNTYTAPSFVTGPYVGGVWMRMSLSANPAPNDFPWNGTVSIGGFNGGETEDYVIMMTPETTDVPGGGHHGLWFGPVVPNPARDRAMFDFALPRDADVSLGVYDLSGRRVAQVEHGRIGAGAHHSGWDFRDDSGREVPVGYYVLKLRVGAEVLTRSVIRVK